MKKYIVVSVIALALGAFAVSGGHAFAFTCPGPNGTVLTGAACPGAGTTTTVGVPLPKTMPCPVNGGMVIGKFLCPTG